jgi:molybdenum cofactor biosynthesis protein B
MSETTRKHREEAPQSVKAAVITISDSKFEYLWTKDEKLEETEDVSGKLIVDALKKAGHEVVFYTIIPDHAGLIAEMVDYIIDRYSPEAIITTGGTGIGPRDVTIEALQSLYEKSLEGFGELFRQRSFAEIGSAAMLSRASCGVISGTIVFSLPGSPNACKLGIELILSELTHLVKHARGG